MEQLLAGGFVGSDGEETGRLRWAVLVSLDLVLLAELMRAVC